MKIVHLTQTNTAYMPARFVYLTNKYTSHTAHLIQEKAFLYGNPLEIPNCKNKDQIMHLLDQADVLHFHGSRTYDRRIICGANINRFYKPRYSKKIVLHFHGTPERERYMRENRNQRKIDLLLLSTPEMIPLFPPSSTRRRVKFFPNLIEEKHAMYSRDASLVCNEKPVIGHHFSFHKRLKDTDAFEAAWNCISNNGQNVDFVKFERMNVDDALRERAKCDVIFDHFQGYYGVVSIETMALGMCVMNGCNKQSMDALLDFFGAKPPFWISNRRKMLTSLRNIDREEIQEKGRKGRLFMEKIWSGAKNIHRLIDEYKKL